MNLKIQRTGSGDFARNIKILTCGEPGSGKTKTAGTWPNPFYIDAEGGLLSIRELDLPYFSLTQTSELLELKNMLEQPANIREKNFGVPVDTVVIDTVDEIARMFQRERIQGSGKDAMAVQDWGWLGEQLRNVLRGFRNLPINVVLNCHLKSQTDEDTGKVWLRPAIAGQVGDEIAGFVDLAVVLSSRPVTEVQNGKNVKKIVRSMQTYQDSRLPWVKDRSGKLPMEFVINFEDDHKRLADLIFGGGPNQAALAQSARTELQEIQEDLKDEATVEEAPPAEEPPKAKKATAKKSSTKKAEPVKSAEEPKAAEPEAPKAQEAPAQEPEPEVEPPAPAEIVEPPAAEPAPVEDKVENPLDLEEASEDASSSQTEPSSASEAPAEESVPADETPAAPAGERDPRFVCEVCDGTIKSKDDSDLSYVRFRKRMCKPCFTAARSKKAS